MKNVVILAFATLTAGETNSGPLGVTTIGPFDNFDAARDYGKDNLAEARWVIADLTDPTAASQSKQQSQVHA